MGGCPVDQPHDAPEDLGEEDPDLPQPARIPHLLDVLAFLVAVCGPGFVHDLLVDVEADSQRSVVLGVGVDDLLEGVGSLRGGLLHAPDVVVDVLRGTDGVVCFWFFCGGRDGGVAVGRGKYLGLVF